MAVWAQNTNWFATTRRQQVVIKYYQQRVHLEVEVNKKKLQQKRSYRDSRWSLETSLKECTHSHTNSCKHPGVNDVVRTHMMQISYRRDVQFVSIVTIYAMLNQQYVSKNSNQWRRRNLLRLPGVARTVSPLSHVARPHRLHHHLTVLFPPRVESAPQFQAQSTEVSSIPLSI